MRILPVTASQVARITVVSHWALALNIFNWRIIVVKFFFGRPSIVCLIVVKSGIE
jgi:hypothetical protein